MKVPGEVLRPHFVPGEKLLQRGRRSSKLARDVDSITWPGSRSQDGSSPRHGAEHDDVGQNPCRGFGSISTGETHLELVGQSQESSQESIHPVLRNATRKSQGEECCNRFAAHSGNVTEAAGQATVADHLGRVPFTAKMNAFQAEVGCDEGLLTCRQAYRSTVVSNTGHQIRISASGSLP